MDADKALATLTALANGIDPNTGEMLDLNGPYQTPEVIRALYVAVGAVEALLPKPKRTKRAPPKAGTPWTDAEDQQLICLFDSGSDLKTIALRHERTVQGVQARLERLGRLPGHTQWRPGMQLIASAPAPNPLEQDSTPTK